MRRAIYNHDLLLLLQLEFSFLELWRSTIDAGNRRREETIKSAETMQAEEPQNATINSAESVSTRGECDNEQQEIAGISSHQSESNEERGNAVEDSSGVEIDNAEADVANINTPSLQAKLVIIVNSALPGALIVIVLLKSKEEMTETASAVAKVYLPSYLLSIFTIAAWTAVGMWMTLSNKDGQTVCQR